MGQQQLLIVILGVLIVGIAVAVALLIFKANAEQSTRNAITNDLGYFAMRAREMYTKPRYLGGADRDFGVIQMSMLTPVPENENARYYIERQSKDELIIVAVGKIVVQDDSIRMRMYVNEATQQIQILN